MINQESLRNKQYNAIGMDEVARDIENIINVVNDYETDKQDTLVSGSNIKTINSESILGLGDIEVQEVLVSATNIKTINDQTLLGSGNIFIGGSGLNTGDVVFVDNKDDLPAASGGVITLADNVTYFFTTTVDLLGDRLVGGNNTTILGGSSENCRIKSTGLTGTALITSVYSLPIRNITIEADVALNLDATGNTTAALDWFGVNFTDCGTVGTIKSYSNFIMQDSAFLNSGGLTFDGSIGTIGMTQCLFDVSATKTAFIIPATLTITRRFRIIYSSFVVLSGETGINFSASATISAERYILDTVNFSGGGTYISGIDYTDNKALFTNCVGITNTSTRGFMYMVNNTNATAAPTTWKKAAGTTTADTLNSKFTHSSNRLTYTGGFTTTFHAFVNCNVSSTNNQNVSIGLAKNGTIITQSEMTVRCSTSSQFYFAATQFPIIMSAGDYVELFVINNTSSSDVLVSDMNMFITKIKE